MVSVTPGQPAAGLSCPPHPAWLCDPEQVSAPRLLGKCRWERCALRPGGTCEESAGALPGDCLTFYFLSSPAFFCCLDCEGSRVTDFVQRKKSINRARLAVYATTPPARNCWIWPCWRWSEGPAGTNPPRSDQRCCCNDQGLGTLGKGRRSCAPGQHAAPAGRAMAQGSGAAERCLTQGRYCPLCDAALELGAGAAVGM